MIIRRNWWKVVLAIVVLVLILVLIGVGYELLVTGEVVLTIVVLILILILVLILVLIGVGYERLAARRWPDWTGFGGYITPRVPKNQTFERGKTLWDWMQLLIIPAVLAVGAYYLNESAHQSDQAIANDNRQEDTLQTYIDRISDLLIKDNLSESIQGNLSESKNESKIRAVARARTLTVLRGLDGNRRGELLQFIYEADLINKNNSVIDLSGADMSKLYLRDAELSEADLNHTNLNEAYLEGSNLSGANLFDANLNGARLNTADLIGANLIVARLSGAYLSANLSGADLRDADLNGAYLSYAELIRANLSYAGLIGADLSNASLIKADLNGADLRKAKLNGADLSGANLSQAWYDRYTTWPEGFDPDAAGAIRANE